MDKKNAITSQIEAQAVLKSRDMHAFDLASYLESLSEHSGENLSDLIRIASSMLSFMNGERHLLFRRVIRQPMSKRSVFCYQERIRKVGKEVVASFLKETAPDLVLHFADPLYLQLVRDIFGVEIVDEKAFLNVVSQATLITEPLRSLKDLKKLQNELVLLEGLVAKQLNNRTANGLASDIYEKSFDDLKDNDIVVLLLALIVAFRTTTETLTSIICKYGELNFQIRERMLSREWLTNNVDHLVRFCASTQYLTRVLKQEKTLSGQTVLGTEQVIVDVQRSNRDASFYQDFVDFSHLEQIESYARCPHVAFGAGAHKCPGADLAKLVIIEVLPVFFEYIESLSFEQGKIRFSSSTFAERIESCPVSIQKI